jgi:hypothetical protein
VPHLKARRGAIVQVVLDCAPGRAFVEPERVDREGRTMDAVVVALKERIAEETAACWQELQALDVVLSEMSEELGGEDLLSANVRGLWASDVAALKSIAEEMHRFGVSISLAEPTREYTERLRKVAESELPR